jgi:hypothetical protein
MVTKMRTAILATVLVAVSTASMASVQDLLGFCESPATSQSYNFCIGYVGGIGDLLVVNRLLYKQGLSEMTGAEICGEPSPSHGAMMQAFRNWAHSHPERWADHEYFGVMLALMDSWPCPR